MPATDCMLIPPSPGMGGARPGEAQVGPCCCDRTRLPGSDSAPPFSAQRPTGLGQKARPDLSGPLRYR